MTAKNRPWKLKPVIRDERIEERKRLLGKHLPYAKVYLEGGIVEILTTCAECGVEYPCEMASKIARAISRSGFVGSVKE